MYGFELTVTENDAVLTLEKLKYPSSSVVVRSVSLSVINKTLALLIAVLLVSVTSPFTRLLVCANAVDAHNINTHNSKREWRFFKRSG